MALVGDISLSQLSNSLGADVQKDSYVPHREAPLPAFFFPGLAWAVAFGVAAGVGLALTMLGAATVHIARGEFKYTWKMNVSLLVLSVVAAVLVALVELQGLN